VNGHRHLGLVQTVASRVHLVGGQGALGGQVEHRVEQAADRGGVGASLDGLDEVPVVGPLDESQVAMGAADLETLDGVTFDSAEDLVCLLARLVRGRPMTLDKEDVAPEDHHHCSQDEEMLGLHDGLSTSVTYCLFAQSQCRRRRHTRIPATMAAPGMNRITTMKMKRIWSPDR